MSVYPGVQDARHVKNFEAQVTFEKRQPEGNRGFAVGWLLAALSGCILRTRLRRGRKIHVVPVYGNVLRRR
jgi:hypothetical protein